MDRAVKFANGPYLKNYHLTFSRSENTSDSTVRDLQTWRKRGNGLLEGITKKILVASALSMATKTMLASVIRLWWWAHTANKGNNPAAMDFIRKTKTLVSNEKKDKMILITVLLVLGITAIAIRVIERYEKWEIT